MGALAVLLLSFFAPDAGLLASMVECVVPEGPVVAEVEWRGQTVRAREGALEIGDRRMTACDGLPGPFPTALVVDGEALWVGFRAAGVQRFDGRRFRPISGLPTDGVRALALRDGRLWIGLGVQGLWWASGLEAKRYGHWILGLKGITALEAGDDALKVAAGPYGIWAVGKAAKRIERGTFAGCFRGGEPVPPGAGCTLDAASPASGLPSGHITALAEHAGDLYVGTFDAGLSRREGPRFVPVDGSPRFVNALLGVGTDLWIATPRGLFVLGSGDVVRRVPAKLPSDHINGLAHDGDTLWIATSRGLAGLGPAGVRIWSRAHGLPGRIVYAVAVARDGAVWAGTDAGAARISETGVQVFDHGNGALPHDWVNALLPDGDAMLVGTYDAGVVRISDGAAAVVPGMDHAWVNPAGLMRVGGRLLVATLGDGLLYRAGDDTIRRPGLPSSDVTAAALHDGRLWIGTRGGLVVSR